MLLLGKGQTSDREGAKPKKSEMYGRYAYPRWAL